MLKEYIHYGKRSHLQARLLNYFTFIRQLDTIGNKKITFWDFFNGIEEYKETLHKQLLAKQHTTSRA
jgi:hypothetical protein